MINTKFNKAAGVHSTESILRTKMVDLEDEPTSQNHRIPAHA